VTRNRVFGLEIQGRGTMPVDVAISTVSGMLTFGSLLDPEHAPEALRRKVRNAPLSQKALSVQLGLSNQLPVSNHTINVLPMMADQHKALQPDPPRWLTFSVPTVTMPELAPAGGSIVEMFPPIDQSWAVDRWTDQAKQAAAEPAIDALARIHKLDIVASRVTSPKDYRDARHMFGAAVYGLSPAAGPTAQFPYKTPIHGLLQAGQTTYPGYGVSTAMWSGILAAETLQQ
jgi:phytoene dehydrogenase-like protein